MPARCRRVLVAVCKSLIRRGGRRRYSTRGEVFTQTLKPCRRKPCPGGTFSIHICNTTLAGHPGVPPSVINSWRDNSFDSTETYPLRRGFRMTEFCRHYPKYTRGPLLKGNNRDDGEAPKSGNFTQEELCRMKERDHER